MGENYYFEPGDIPNNWEIKTIGEISEKVTDGSHVSPKPCTVGKYMCSVKDMTYNRFNFSNCKLISPNDFEKLVKQGCKPLKNDILISKDGANCLDLIFVFNQEEELVLLSSIAIVRLLSDSEPKFVCYFLLSPACQYTMRNSFVSGSAIPRVILKDFKRVPILLPPLPEQKAIATVLSSLDDKIDLLHRQNKTLEKIAETLFRQWFIEEAQEDWEIRKLGELVSITRGASPRPIIEYVKNGTVPWIKIADATGSSSFFITSTKEYIIKEGVSKSVQVFPDDLILSNSATCGLPFFVEIQGCIHDGWLLFRDFDVLSKYFIFFFLKQITQELISVADGTVQDNLNTGILKNYELKVPPPNQIDKFDKSVGSLIIKTKSNNNQIRTLEKLRDNLLPKLMSGEVRVNYE
ncbi:MAG: restriction endonuclease subunit S [Proteobacteria bacterium]|nr:restriction endonuclease subunit S [Pseudomonadota bacterium]